MYIRQNLLFSFDTMLFKELKVYHAIQALRKN